MRPQDILHFALTALTRQRFRAAMVLLATGIGVASVIALTALGEGARRYVLNEFSALGTDVLIVFPGKKETSGGGMPPVTGNAARELTLEDAQAVQRSIPGVQKVAPLVLGNQLAQRGSKGQDALVIGTSADFAVIRKIKIAQGNNLPAVELDRAVPVCLIGDGVRKELFGEKPALGEFIRLGGVRFRVIGLLAGRGDSSGMNLEDAVLIPVASAQQLFNSSGLFRMLVKVSEQVGLPAASREIRALIKARHEGEEDITVVTPDAILATFDKLLTGLTLAVGGIAAISLVVAGVLTMNVTLITVQQRAQEIGLLKALGAASRTVQQLFLTEATLLSGTGALAGAAMGLGLVALGRYLMPSFPMHSPSWVVLAAIITATLAGLGFSVGPARQAARLEPVTALQKR